jgi:hypothetical protein
MGKIKGIVLLETVKYLKKRLEEARDALPNELHHYLEEDIEVSSWYPETDASALFAHAAKLHSGAADRALELMGEAAARSHHEVYRGLLTGSGSGSRAFALWSNQHDTGTLRRIRESPNVVRFELTEFEDTSRELCLILGGYLKGAAALAGKTNTIVAKLGCRLWGDDTCYWRVTQTSADFDTEPSTATALFDVPGTIIVEHYPKQRALVAAWDSVTTPHFREVIERGLLECGRLRVTCWVADLTRCLDLPKPEDVAWLEASDGGDGRQETGAAGTGQRSRNQCDGLDRLSRVDKNRSGRWACDLRLQESRGGSTSRLGARALTSSSVAGVRLPCNPGPPGLAHAIDGVADHVSAELAFDASLDCAQDEPVQVYPEHRSNVDGVLVKASRQTDGMLDRPWLHDSPLPLEITPRTGVAFQRAL